MCEYVGVVKRSGGARRARLLAALLVLPMAGCGWLFGPSVPKDPYAKFRTQPGVVRLPDSPLGGRIELTYRGTDFAEGNLEVPAGDYQIVVRNEDSLTDVGIFLRKPDRYGRETGGHVAAGGGVRIGDSRVFPVELEAGNSYLYHNPITQSPSHQITVVEAVGPPKMPSEPGPGTSPEELTPEEEAAAEALAAQAGLDGAPAEAAGEAPADAIAPPSEGEVVDEAAAEPEPLVKELEPPVAEMQTPDKEADKSTDPDLQFSPEVEQLLDAFDRADRDR